MLKYFNQIFSLKYINDSHYPKILKENISFPMQVKRLNHYCIKLNSNNNYNFGDLNDETISKIKEFIYYLPKELNLDDRYCYLTIDNKKVSKGFSQRDSGFHIDGFQGDEVPIKKEGDITLIWMNSLPTEYITNIKIDEKLNISKYNIFKHIDKNVKINEIKELKLNTLYLINSYQVHRSQIAKHETNRLFIRISFSKIPITSKKMSINSKIKYNYNIHSTSGEIPTNLD